MRHKMFAVIEVQPEVARKEMLRAFKKSRCHYGDTAGELGCHVHTLMRWIELLQLRGEFDRMEKRAVSDGWHHGRKGGGAYHRDPQARVLKAEQTRAARGALRGKPASSKSHAA